MLREGSWHWRSGSRRAGSLTGVVERMGAAAGWSRRAGRGGANGGGSGCWRRRAGRGGANGSGGGCWSGRGRGRPVTQQTRGGRTKVFLHSTLFRCRDRDFINSSRGELVQLVQFIMK
jgi:hypothetical protein